MENNTLGKVGILKIENITGITQKCGRNGFCQTRVAACCRGEYGCKTYKGYKWSYAPL